MKNTNKFKDMPRIAGFIAIVAVIGFMAVACDGDKDEIDIDLDGTTWKATENGLTMTFTFNRPNVTYTSIDGSDTVTTQGTYSVSGNKVTITLAVVGEGYTITVTGIISGNTITFAEISEQKFTKQ